MDAQRYNLERTPFAWCIKDRDTGKRVENDHGKTAFYWDLSKARQVCKYLNSFPKK